LNRFVHKEKEKRKGKRKKKRKKKKEKEGKDNLKIRESKREMLRNKFIQPVRKSHSLRNNKYVFSIEFVRGIFFHVNN
jgi:hypothetical protein